ncbi:MAG: hypothetical protein V1647_06320 [Pseudomonadota bacterium]
MINLDLTFLPLILAACSVIEFIIGFLLPRAQGILSIAAGIIISAMAFMGIFTAVDTLSIGILLVSLTFTFISVGSIRDHEDNKLYYPCLSAVGALSLGFLISNELILKLILWETVWIPVFIILLLSKERKLSVLFSKLWFLSEALIISSFILMQNKADQNLVFWLMISGLLIRIWAFPFDVLVKKTVAQCSFHISSVVGVLLPILPIFFAIQVIQPAFQNELGHFYEIISWVFISGIIVWAIRLAVDANVNTLVSSQIVIFNSIVGLCLTNTSDVFLKAVLEIIFVKTLINILITFYGDETKTNSRTWMFAIPVITAFGIPGIIIGIPLLTLISGWYAVDPAISISILILLMACFAYSSVIITPLFASRHGIKLNFKTSAFILLFTFIIASSLFFSRGF